MLVLRRILAAGILVPLCQARAPSGPWDAFNLAPKARDVRPVKVFKSVGKVSNADSLVTGSGSATITGNQSWIALDFGAEVGGLMSMEFDAADSNSAIALSWSESPAYVSPITSDTSSFPSPSMNDDGVLTVPRPIPKGSWTQPSFSLRGGFRYFTIVSTGSGSVSISNVSLEISFMPHVQDMRAYSGYFYAKDSQSKDVDFLSKLWYAGAYTVQTNIVDVNQGRQSLRQGWQNNATLGDASPIIVDGAKRDRAVWPGDMGVAVPTQFVSTNDLLPTKNALATLFHRINPTTGALPRCGPPMNQQGSFTYHSWSLIGVHNYVLFSGDITFLSTLWTNYTKAVDFLERSVDSSGLLNVPSSQAKDWGRVTGTGGYVGAANMLLYRVLTISAELAGYVNNSQLSTEYAANATSLKSHINSRFWSAADGLYQDVAGNNTLHPQDANSFAVAFNVTESAAKNTAISDALRARWTSLGPVAPELPDTISPFISSFELQAHFLANEDARALDLMRTEWGYMLNTNLSVQSSLLEGFTSNGSLGYRAAAGYNFDFSYTSHAHGWSTGPTFALHFYVLGVQVSSAGGRTWTFRPHLSGLPAAEGGFETSLGTFRALWNTTTSAFAAVISTPASTSGLVCPPGKNATLDGKTVVLDSSGCFEASGGSRTITSSL